MFVCLYVCVSAARVGIHKNQKRALNPLQLELEPSTRNGNLGPLKEQQALDCWTISLAP